MRTSLFTGISMKCPVCRVPMRRVMYERFAIHQCPQCLGHLIASGRVEFIKGRRDKTPDELMAEVDAASGADTLERLRCPGCGRQMQKLKLDPPADFYYDECGACQHHWYDGGELARLKLSYQISEQGKEAGELQRRLRELSPQRQAALRENLQALPGEEDDVSGMLRSAFSPRE